MGCFGPFFINRHIDAEVTVAAMKVDSGHSHITEYPHSFSRMLCGELGHIGNHSISFIIGIASATTENIKRKIKMEANFKEDIYISK